MKSIEEIILGLQNLTLRENEFIEFKINMPLSYELMAKHFVGIANNSGGYYIIGVKEVDKGIELVGAKKEMSL